MEVESMTVYTQDGGYKSMGWEINNSILSGGGGSNLVVPATLLYINNNFNCKTCNSIQKDVVESDLFDRLYSFIDKSATRKNKTKKRKKKRKNKTRRY